MSFICSYLLSKVAVIEKYKIRRKVYKFVISTSSYYQNSVKYPMIDGFCSIQYVADVSAFEHIRDNRLQHKLVIVQLKENKFFNLKIKTKQ